MGIKFPWWLVIQENSRSPRKLDGPGAGFHSLSSLSASHSPYIHAASSEVRTSSIAAECMLYVLMDWTPSARFARTLLCVKRVLLTGMSGTGKSSVARELAARGFKAIDTDDGWSRPLPNGRQMWREDAIQALLATEDADVLFVAGCEENQAQFHAQFDHIVLQSAPPKTVLCAGVRPAIQRMAALNGCHCG
jgi:hypothetical protein